MWIELVSVFVNKLFEILQTHNFLATAPIPEHNWKYLIDRISILGVSSLIWLKKHLFFEFDYSPKNEIIYNFVRTSDQNKISIWVRQQDCP